MNPLSPGSKSDKVQESYSSLQSAINGKRRISVLDESAVYNQFMRRLNRVWVMSLIEASRHSQRTKSRERSRDNSHLKKSTSTISTSGGAWGMVQNRLRRRHHSASGSDNGAEGVWQVRWWKVDKDFESSVPHDVAGSDDADDKIEDLGRGAVVRLIRNLGLSRYASRFRALGVTGSDLASCTEEELIQIGIHFRPHRQRLLREVRNWVGQTDRLTSEDEQRLHLGRAREKRSVTWPPPLSFAEGLSIAHDTRGRTPTRVPCRSEEDWSSKDLVTSPIQGKQCCPKQPQQIEVSVVPGTDEPTFAMERSAGIIESLSPVPAQSLEENDSTAEAIVQADMRRDRDEESAEMGAELHDVAFEQAGRHKQDFQVVDCLRQGNFDRGQDRRERGHVDTKAEHVVSLKDLASKASGTLRISGSRETEIQILYNGGKPTLLLRICDQPRGGEQTMVSGGKDSKTSAAAPLLPSAPKHCEAKHSGSFDTKRKADSRADAVAGEENRNLLASGAVGDVCDDGSKWQHLAPGCDILRDASVLLPSSLDPIDASHDAATTIQHALHSTSRADSRMLRLFGRHGGGSPGEWALTLSFPPDDDPDDGVGKDAEPGVPAPEAHGPEIFTARATSRIEDVVKRLRISTPMISSESGSNLLQADPGQSRETIQDALSAVRQHGVAIVAKKRRSTVLLEEVARKTGIIEQVFQLAHGKRRTLLGQGDRIGQHSQDQERQGPTMLQVRRVNESPRISEETSDAESEGSDAMVLGSEARYRRPSEASTRCLEEGVAPTPGGGDGGRVGADDDAATRLQRFARRWVTAKKVSRAQQRKLDLIRRVQVAIRVQRIVRCRLAITRARRLRKRNLELEEGRSSGSWRSQGAESRTFSGTGTKTSGSPETSATSNKTLYNGAGDDAGKSDGSSRTASTGATESETDGASSGGTESYTSSDSADYSYEEHESTSGDDTATEYSAFESDSSSNARSGAEGRRGTESLSESDSSHTESWPKRLGGQENASSTHRMPLPVEAGTAALDDIDRAIPARQVGEQFETPESRPQMTREGAAERIQRMFRKHAVEMKTKASNRQKNPNNARALIEKSPTVEHQGEATACTEGMVRIQRTIQEQARASRTHSGDVGDLGRAARQAIARDVESTVTMDQSASSTYLTDLPWKRNSRKGDAVATPSPSKPEQARESNHYFDVGEQGDEENRTLENHFQDHILEATTRPGRSEALNDESYKHQALDQDRGMMMSSLFAKMIDAARSAPSRNLTSLLTPSALCGNRKNPSIESGGFSERDEASGEAKGQEYQQGSWDDVSQAHGGSFSGVNIEDERWHDRHANVLKEKSVTNDDEKAQGGVDSGLMSLMTLATAPELQQQQGLGENAGGIAVLGAVGQTYEPVMPAEAEQGKSSVPHADWRAWSKSPDTLQQVDPGGQSRRDESVATNRETGPRLDVGRVAASTIVGELVVDQGGPSGELGDESFRPRGHSDGANVTPTMGRIVSGGFMERETAERYTDGDTLAHVRRTHSTAETLEFGEGPRGVTVAQDGSFISESMTKEVMERDGSSAPEARKYQVGSDPVEATIGPSMTVQNAPQATHEDRRVPSHDMLGAQTLTRSGRGDTAETAAITAAHHGAMTGVLRGHEGPDIGTTKPPGMTGAPEVTIAHGASTTIPSGRILDAHDVAPDTNTEQCDVSPGRGKSEDERDSARTGGLTFDGDPFQVSADHCYNEYPINMPTRQPVATSEDQTPDRQSGEYRLTQDADEAGAALKSPTRMYVPEGEGHESDPASHALQPVAGWGSDSAQVSPMRMYVPEGEGYDDKPASHALEQVGGWEAFYDSDSAQVYYFHPETQMTSWEHPGTRSTSEPPVDLEIRTDVSGGSNTEMVGHVTPGGASSQEENGHEFSLLAQQIFSPSSETAERLVSSPYTKGGMSADAKDEGSTRGQHAVTRGTPDTNLQYPYDAGAGSYAPSEYWQESVDPSTGHTFYFNPTTQESAWELPEGAEVVPAAQGAAAEAEHTTTAQGLPLFEATEGSGRPAHGIVVNPNVMSLDGSLVYPGSAYDLDYD